MRVAALALLIATAALLELTPSTAVAAPNEPFVRDVIVAVSGSVPKESRRTPARIRSVNASIRAQARSLGVKPLETYATATRFFTARVTPAQYTRLDRDPSVLTIIEDELIEDEGGPDDSDSKIIGRPTREQIGRQLTPKWMKRIGVTAVDHRLGKGKRRRPFDADIAIIDSGISPNHPDVRPAGGKDCTHSGGWGDGYGHGLGVASILGALDNNRGTVGMLPGVRLWSVRIFDKQGRTRLSWVLCGLDWVANKRDPKHHKRPFFEGATLSFSVGGASRRPIPNGTCGRRPIDLVHQAICRIERQGTILVAAAGNYGQKAAKRRPAGYQEVITVSAMADFDGKPGGKGKPDTSLPGRVSTGAGRPVRDLLLLRRGRRPHRARQVHLGRVPRQDLRPGLRAHRSRHPWCSAPRCSTGSDTRRQAPAGPPGARLCGSQGLARRLRPGLVPRATGRRAPLPAAAHVRVPAARPSSPATFGRPGDGVAPTSTPARPHRAHRPGEAPRPQGRAGTHRGLHRDHPRQVHGQARQAEA